MKSEKLLRKAVLSNAAFSFISGIILTGFNQEVANLLNLENAGILIWIGIGLLLFVMSLLYAATRKPLNPLQIKVIIYQDWAWVVGSFILLMTKPFDVSTIGYVLVILIASIVAVFALLQANNLRKLNR